MLLSAARISAFVRVACGRIWVILLHVVGDCMRRQPSLGPGFLGQRGADGRFSTEPNGVCVGLSNRASQQRLRPTPGSRDANLGDRSWLTWRLRWAPRRRTSPPPIGGRSTRGLGPCTVGAACGEPGTPAPRLRDEPFLGGLRQLLEGAFDAQRVAECADAPTEDEAQRSSASQRLGSFAGAVLGEAPVGVEGDAGIESVIRTPHHVEPPGLVLRQGDHEFVVVTTMPRAMAVWYRTFGSFSSAPGAIVARS